MDYSNMTIRMYRFVICQMAENPNEKGNENSKKPFNQPKQPPRIKRIMLQSHKYADNLKFPNLYS